MRTLYGPIDSWRFGRSLGIDPLAQKAKLCPYNCIYCQYGPTREPALRRRSLVSSARLQSDLETLSPVDCDQITFAGLGEPTLARNLGELVEVVRQQIAKPIAILTGGALLPEADVRRDLTTFDHVVVKLDAPDERLFRQINRPPSGYPYTWTALLESIHAFRREYAGRLSLQMMFLQVNAHAAAQMADLARSVQADEIHLDTPLQPALGGPVSASQMKTIAKAFASPPPRVVVRNLYRDGQAQVSPRLF